MITAANLWSYIESHRRIHGSPPKLRECVEHFDGKLLNVLMCLGELRDSEKRELRQAVSAARRKRGGVA